MRAAIGAGATAPSPTMSLPLPDRSGEQAQSPAGIDGPTTKITALLTPATGNTPSGPRTLNFQLGKYLLKREIGHGGMGVVYEAQDTALERRVALKLISAELMKTPEQVSRFLAEARAAAKLAHPNVIAVYDFGQQDETPYLVMELVEGRDLTAMIKSEGKIRPEVAVPIVRQAAEGLSHAASQQIVHRDVKPSNIFITNSGIAKVMDFGLAKRLDRDTSLTASGAILGTPDYIAPEQARGENVDFRTDVYSLGCTLFTALAGKRPFQSSTAFEVMLKHIEQPLDIPAEVRAMAGGRIAAVIEKMTAKDPSRRYASWQEAIDALRKLEHDLAHGPSRPAIPAGLLKAGALVLSVALAAGGAVFAVSYLKGDTAPAAAVAAPTPTPAPTTIAAAEPPPDEEVGRRPAPFRNLVDNAAAALVGRDEVNKLLAEGEFDAALVRLKEMGEEMESRPLRVRNMRKVHEWMVRSVEDIVQFDAAVRRKIRGTDAGQPVPAVPMPERVEYVKSVLDKAMATAPEHGIWNAVVFLHLIDDPESGRYMNKLHGEREDVAVKPGHDEQMDSLIIFVRGVEGPGGDGPPPRRGPGKGPDGERRRPMRPGQ